VAGVRSPPWCSPSHQGRSAPHGPQRLGLRGSPCLRGLFSTGPLGPGAVLSGSVTIEPEATLAGGAADRFELFVGGLRVAACGPGGRLALDTASLADGHHEIRVIAIAATPLETQGRSVIPVVFANHGRTLALAVAPQRCAVVEDTLTGAAAGLAAGAAVFAYVPQGEAEAFHRAGVAAVFSDMALLPALLS
jgi:hypothetical protein